MQTNLYIIRHGESEANVRNAFLGWGDLPLTQLGHQQAQATARYLDAIPADAIYASTLTRACQTAEATASRRGMTIQKDANLREIHAGLWEFETFDDLKQKFPESFGLWCENIGLARCDGGESVAQLQERFVTAVKNIAEKHAGQTVFIFTHATPLRTLAAHCLQKLPETMKEVPWANNASVTRVIYENGKLTLVEYSRDDFMGSLTTSLPDNV